MYAFARRRYYDFASVIYIFCLMRAYKHLALSNVDKLVALYTHADFREEVRVENRSIPMRKWFDRRKVFVWKFTIHKKLWYRNTHVKIGKARGYFFIFFTASLKVIALLSEARVSAIIQSCKFVWRCHIYRYWCQQWSSYMPEWWQ